MENKTSTTNGGFDYEGLDYLLETTFLPYYNKTKEKIFEESGILDGIPFVLKKIGVLFDNYIDILEKNPKYVNKIKSDYPDLEYKLCQTNTVLGRFADIQLLDEVAVKLGKTFNKDNVAGEFIYKIGNYQLRLDMLGFSGYSENITVDKKDKKPDNNKEKINEVREIEVEDNEKVIILEDRVMSSDGSIAKRPENASIFEKTFDALNTLGLFTNELDPNLKMVEKIEGGKK
ncbi:MAG: hypothetical protein AB1571_02140 [Nanoarchaeota archaeon]